MPSSVLILRARTLLTLAGETAARGGNLFAPLKKIDNAALVVRDGHVEATFSWPGSHMPAGARVRDLGSVCLAPACVNAHTHLNLSHLAGRTTWHRGFTPWLASLVPMLAEPVSSAALEEACADIAGSGAVHVGDFSGTLSTGPAQADQACRACGLGVTHFCEWFGFKSPLIDTISPWPPHCRKALAENPAIASRAAPCGHALYSTSPKALRAAKEHCTRNNRIFAFHLAESPEETEMLTKGRSSLKDLYADRVLPGTWRAPGLRPMAYAAALGLLGPGALAVHGTQLNTAEAAELATTGTALCLCPRSNNNLGLGPPPVRELLGSGVLLCLGTDGLTTNSDLDVRKEAVYLRETMDVQPEALVRLLTVNGAAALGLAGAGQLTRNSPAAFCILPESLTY